MPRSTVKERILLHLRGYEDYLNRKSVPYKITQAGIAETLDISLGHVSKVIQRLKETEDDILQEELKHIEGLKRKRKVYFLTPKGIEKEKSIRERLMEEKVNVKEDNNYFEVHLKDIHKYIESKDPLLDGLVMFHQDGVIDLTKSIKEGDIFVGREDELNFLSNLIDKVTQEGSKAVLIKGEAGIGKTRLVNEFRKIVIKQGYGFLKGNSYVDSSDPYLPLKDAISGYLKDLGPEEARNYYSLPFVNPINGLEIENKLMFDEKRETTFYKTTEFVKDLTSNKPIVIFIDDLQWVDDATLDLFYYMLNKIRDEPVFFIGTYRPEDVQVGDRLRNILQKASRENLYEEIELNRLSFEETKSIVKKMLSKPEADIDFVKTLYTKTEGNPLFIKEYLKEIEEEGVSIEHHEITIPDMISNIIDRRIDRLDDETRRILEVGSVIGDEIQFDLLLEILDMYEMELLELIEVLLRDGLWREDYEEKKFYFTHRMILETVYDGISVIRKKHIHKTVAEKIEELWGDELKEEYATLALHYNRADQYRNALDYYIKAGGYAKEVFAHDNAIKHYEKALKLCDQIDDEEDIDKIEIYEELASTLTLVGKYEGSRKYYEQALLESQDIDTQQRLYAEISMTYGLQANFDMALKLIDKGLKLSTEKSEERGNLLYKKAWIFLRLGDYNKARELLNELNELLDYVDVIEMRGDTEDIIATLASYEHDYENAIEGYKKALEIWKKIDDKVGLGKTYNNIGTVYSDMGDYDRSLEYLEKGLDIWNDIGFKNGTAITLNNIGMAKENKGLLDEALKDYRAAYTIHKKAGNKHGIGMVKHNLGKISRKKGDLQKAMTEYNKSLSLREDIDDKKGVGETQREIGIVYFYKNELQKAQDHFEKSLEIFKKIDDKKGIAKILKEIGELFFCKGETEKSISHYKRSLEISLDLSVEPLVIQNLCDLIETYIKLSDDEKISEYLSRLEEKRLGIQSSIPLKYHIQKTLGLVDMYNENYENSMEKIYSSLKYAETIGEVIKIGESKFILSKIYQKSGDSNKSMKQLSEAQNIFKKHAFNLWADKCL